MVPPPGCTDNVSYSTWDHGSQIIVYNDDVPSIMTSSLWPVIGYSGHVIYRTSPLWPCKRRPANDHETVRGELVCDLNASRYVIISFSFAAYAGLLKMS